jgi:hypothetical protein
MWAARKLREGSLVKECHSGRSACGVVLPSEPQKSTPLSRSKPSARRSEMGHFHPYAASSGIGCRAPIPDLPALAPERGGSILSRHSAPRKAKTPARPGLSRMANYQTWASRNRISQSRDIDFSISYEIGKSKGRDCLLILKQCVLSTRAAA